MLVNWAVLPLDAGIAKDQDKLARFLKTALSGFCRKNARRELWGCISSANVETRALKIPKVPAKQLPNAVLWAFRKEAGFNEKDDIFDYQVVGEIVEDNGPKLQVMASTAPKQEVATLRRLFARAGHPLTGVSIVPFALQNLLQSGWLEADDGGVCALFIGRDWSRIAIFSQGHLVLSRDIKAGMKSLVQAVSEGIESLQEELVRAYARHARPGLGRVVGSAHAARCGTGPPGARRVHCRLGRRSRGGGPSRRRPVRH